MRKWSHRSPPLLKGRGWALDRVVLRAWPAVLGPTARLSHQVTRCGRPLLCPGSGGSQLTLTAPVSPHP